MNKALVISGVSALVILIFNLLVFVFLKDGESQDMYADYAVFKRSISVVTSIGLLGLPTALARNSPLFKDSSRQIVLQCVLASIIVISGFYLSTRWTSCLEQFKLPDSAWFYLSSVALCTISSSRFRGKLKFLEANFINASAPIVLTVSIMCSQGLDSAFGKATVTQLLIFLITLTRHDQNPIDSTSATTFQSIAPYLRIGIPRIPGDFLIQALFSIPLVLYSTSNASSSQIGDFGFVLALLGVVIQIASPIGFVYLPYLSEYKATGTHGAFTLAIRRLSAATLALAVLIVLIPEMIMALRVPLLSPYNPVLSRLCDLKWTSVGLAIYVMLRSVNDALYRAPINTIVLACAFACILLNLQNTCDLTQIINALNQAFILLGVLTIFTVSFKLYKSKLASEAEAN